MVIAGALLLLTWRTMSLGGGDKPSLALDPAGNPALSYTRGVPDPERFAGGDTRLVYAANDGGWPTGMGWTQEDLSGETGKVEGRANALAFGACGQPQIAYTVRNRLDSTSGFVLNLARFDALDGLWLFTSIHPRSWIWQVRQSVYGPWTFVGHVGTSGDPWVDVARSSDGGESWELSSAPARRDLLFSLDFAASGSGVLGVATTKLAALPPDSQGVRFAWSSDGGENWQVTRIDERTSVIAPALVFGADGNPVVAYSAGSQFQVLHVARSPDGGWSWDVEVVPTQGSSIASALAIDAVGDLFLAFRATHVESRTDVLYFGTRDAVSGSWQLQPVDAVDAPFTFGVDVRLVAAPSGTLFVAYARHLGSDISHIKLAWTE